MADFPNRHSLEGGNPQAFVTDHLDIWTSAIKTKSAAGRGSSKKLELVGIKKLRELILELAVRGKLVPQDANDEPACELLKRIEAEKNRLVIVGKIKKPKPLSPISEGEKLFKLPLGWEWEKLGNIFEVTSSKRINAKDYVPDGVPFFRSKEIGDLYRKEEINTEIFISNELFESLKRQSGFPLLGDLMLTAVGSIGNQWICDGRDFYYKDGNIAKIGFINEFSMEYLSKFIASNSFFTQVLDTVSGTAYSALTIVKLNNIRLPIPSQTEQHRIVAKVDELMALCDQLEAQTESSIDAHKTLVEVLLATLTDAKDAEELNDNWQTISQHFDVLFTTQASIDQLKQTILQLAVMGKLVKQDPKDEPASVLLEKIAEEKAQLIKDKKIKKQTLLPAITDEKKPFEIPTGWSYTRLDDLCANVFSGSTPPKSELNETSGIPFLKVYNIQNQELEFEQRTLFVSENSHSGKLKRSILYPGDVILNLVGPPLGKVAIMPNTYPEWNCNQNIICFRPLEIKLNRYIYTYLKAHIFLDYIDLVGSAGQDFISGAKCRAIVLPTPPLAEQHRIVTKVDELMILCDSLKAYLNQAQTTQLQLTDAIVEQAL
jgi:type I restriction enzyme S subunit